MLYTFVLSALLLRRPVNQLKNAVLVFKKKRDWTLKENGDSTCVMI
jgi:hypothetical protein